MQYSEHSSYNELKRFIRFIQPRDVISTVPLSSKNMEETPKIPNSWLNRELKPNRPTGQANIMDYMKVSSLVKIFISGVYSPQFFFYTFLTFREALVNHFKKYNWIIANRPSKQFIYMTLIQTGCHKAVWNNSKNSA